MKKLGQWFLISFVLNAGVCLSVHGGQYDFNKEFPVQLVYRGIIGLDKEIKLQNMYVMPIPKANNAISESMAEAYEQKVASSSYTAGNAWGYTTGQEEYAAWLKPLKDTTVQSFGYGAGTFVQEAAFTILKGRGGQNSQYKYLLVKGVGMADNAEVYNEKAISLVGEKHKNNVTYHYFMNDITK